MASFHFSTLEEYYTGGLFLGPFNGVSDGSAGIYFIFIFMMIFGNDFWTWTLIDRGEQSIRLVDLAIAGTVIG